MTVDTTWPDAVPRVAKDMRQAVVDRRPSLNAALKGSAERGAL